MIPDDTEVVSRLIYTDCTCSKFTIRNAFPEIDSVVMFEVC
jgi:hypothetical protein